MRYRTLLINFTRHYRVCAAVLLLLFGLNVVSAAPAQLEPWLALAHTSFKHHPVTAGGVFVQDPSGFIWMGTQWDPLESTCRHASLSIL